MPDELTDFVEVNKEARTIYYKHLEDKLPYTIFLEALTSYLIDTNY